GYAHPVSGLHAHAHQAVGQLIAGFGKARIRPTVYVAELVFGVNGGASAFMGIFGPAMQTRLGDVELRGDKPLIRRVQLRVLIVHFCGESAWQVKAWASDTPQA